jgi:peptidoglycan/LPS O-acetylase OafA/YrhL
MRQRPWLRGLLALSAPLLLVLALVVASHRQGHDRLPALPALVIGVCLLATSVNNRRRRRRRLLEALRQGAPSARLGE